MRIKIATHSGRWHSDEIFAIACLYLLYPFATIEIIRTRNKALYDECDFVVDVGGYFDHEKYFDHHQLDFNMAREDGVPYASFGLIWKKFGEHICGSRHIAKIVDKRLVRTVDAFDCGGAKISAFYNNSTPLNTFNVSDIFSNLANDFLDEEQYPLETFNQCVNLAKGIIANLIKTIKTEIAADSLIKKTIAMSDSENILILDVSIPYKRFIKKYPQIMAVIMPNDDHEKNYSVYIINHSCSSLCIPSTWLLNHNSSGVSDVIYINKNKSQIVTSSRASAKTVAENVIKIFNISQKPLSQN